MDSCSVEMAYSVKSMYNGIVDRAVPDSFPAPVTPRLSSASISRRSLSAERSSGSISKSNASISAEDRLSYDGGFRAVPVGSNAKDGVKRLSYSSSMVFEAVLRSLGEKLEKGGRHTAIHESSKAVICFNRLVELPLDVVRSLRQSGCIEFIVVIFVGLPFTGDKRR